ncbi:MAG: PAS domain-containing sensor histidine kinase [Candidatus Cyclonatronum sp.]|uniref:sensor histidine kinase n=1 Tax=Cyclonatronum sp. TaxID=3024185 RepID=UPI0025B9A7CB|nr:PAS domain-containing sensor histidine kinase [Cyclonatronum sp.]MCH8486426.1 PAS domain-containing sensor histidine kinase [Cyclonatronum sp.]
MKEYSKQELTQLIENVSFMKGLNLEELRNKPIDHILETISIYHQELEFQNKELVRAQEAITRSEKKYAELFYQAPVGYVIISDEREILDVNKAFCDLCGYSKAELAHNTITDYIHPDFQDQFYLFVYRLFRGKKADQQPAQSIDLRLNGKYEQPFVMLSASATVLTDSDADALKVYKITVTNIDAQKRKEHALSISEAKFRTLVRNAPVGFLIADDEDRIVYMNNHCSQLTGYNPDVLSDMAAFWKKTGGEKEGEPMENWAVLKQEARSHTGCSKIYISTFRRADGSSLYLELSTIALGDLFILSLVDLTQHHKLEETLKKANRDLEVLNQQKLKLLSIIGHDLRTPISSIQGFADLLHEDLSEGSFDSALKFASIIQKAAQKSMSLLLNLVDWARMQREGVAFNAALLNLNEMVEETRSFFREVAAQKEIAIHLEAGQQIQVVADKQYLQTLLRNLLSNAVKFSYPNQTVSLRLDLTDDGSSAVIEVQDKGVGIDEDQIPMLFEPGTRYNRSGTNGEQSAGLGLILCKEIVDLHKGSLSVKSSPGNGSVFTVKLPCNISEFSRSL